MKLQHYRKQTTNTLQQQINNATNKNHNKINAVSYNTVQGHPNTDQIVY